MAKKFLEQCLSIKKKDDTTILFTKDDGLYSLRYPQSWRLEDNQKNGYIQILNYPEPETFQKGWKDGQNKIEGGSVLNIIEVVDWDKYSAVEIAGKKVYILKEGYEGYNDPDNWAWTSIAIPLPSDNEKVVSFIIYGDMNNFDLMANTLLGNFYFK